MWMVFLVIALIWVCMLLFHITLELNTLDKSVTKLAESLRKHYGST
jgi:hypothetical protein